MKRLDVVKYLPKHPSKNWVSRPTSSIDSIVIHHSGTVGGDPWSLADYHINQHGWPGIGYYVVIMPDGTRFKTNLDKHINYHTGGYNQRSVGICLIGNLSQQSATSEQIFSLLKELRLYGRAYSISSSKILGHNEAPGHSSNECPGSYIDMDMLRGAYRMIRI